MDIFEILPCKYKAYIALANSSVVSICILMGKDYKMFSLILLYLSVYSTDGSDVSITTMETITKCTSQHMMEAVKQSSHCQPMVKVLRLDIPRNGSFTQV